jgi:hypothetical protein
MSNLTDVGETIATSVSLEVYRHSLLVRITNWVNTVTFLILIPSGALILWVHPELYWGETGSYGDPAWLRLLADLRGLPSHSQVTQHGCERGVSGNHAAALTVIQQDSPDTYRVLEDASAPFGGHFVIVDPAIHRIYIAHFGRIAVYDVSDVS